MITMIIATRIAVGVTRMAGVGIARGIAIRISIGIAIGITIGDDHGDRHKDSVKDSRPSCILRRCVLCQKKNGIVINITNDAPCIVPTDRPPYPLPQTIETDMKINSPPHALSPPTVAFPATTRLAQSNLPHQLAMTFPG